jgi:hypothetical protein
MDWSHTRKRWRDTKGRLTIEPPGKQEEMKTKKVVGKRRSAIKEAGRSWNKLRFLAADTSGKNS